MRQSFFAILLALLVLWQSPVSSAAPGNAIDWQPWSATTFKQAHAQHRYVFLYLEAVWCHWCHAMQKDTLSDPAVQKALARNYIAIKVDHDANPLLATRYRDYGWPALIFLAADGTEIVKRAGYLSPRDFQDLLAAIVADPTPEQDNGFVTTNTGSRQLSAAQKSKLLGLHETSYDAKLGGLNTAQKFIDRDSVEYAMAHAKTPAEATKARQTLDAARALIDPVWGGAYQYSTGGDWLHPHYEKIMRVQAGYLRTYAQAYAQWHRPVDLQTAMAIRDYMKHFLRSPQGAFYVSQDADLVQGQNAEDYFQLNDAERRQRGMPRIDKHLYADANGMAIEALVQLHEACGDPESLEMARAAAQWTVRHRSLKGGGFTHDGSKTQKPYLSDSLAMGRASLAMYRATGERQWLAQASHAAEFIVRNFRGKDAGFLAGTAEDSPLAPLPDLADNISVARFFNLLRYYNGQAALGTESEHAMKFISAKAGEADFEEAGILLADEELSSEPAHFTVVAARNDQSGQALYAVALRSKGHYKRVEWWDPATGPLANADVSYPRFSKASAYICAAGRCSAPSFTAADYAKRIAATTGQ